MSWEFRGRKLIVHSNDHTVELLEGTWGEPYDIKPSFIKGKTSPSETACLLREGLKFAALNFKSAFPATAQTQRVSRPSTPGSTLSLKRKPVEA